MDKQIRFENQAKVIKNKHWNQTVEATVELNEKYANKIVFGEITPWSIIEKLGLVIDPTDKKLCCVSQWIHTLQVLEAMEQDKIIDEEFLLAGLLHDAGKVLLLVGEKAENVVCDNGIIYGQEGIGLDNCSLHWNHDEFGYLKFKDLISPDMSWLIRYHSVKLMDVEKYMNANDKRLAHKYLDRFRKYDKGSKSLWNIPQIDIEKYRRLMEKHLPATISF